MKALLGIEDIRGVKMIDDYLKYEINLEEARLCASDHGQSLVLFSG